MEDGDYLTMDPACDSQRRAMKTYLKASCRLSDLPRAQRIDRMTSSLKRWIENEASNKGDLEEDEYRSSDNTSCRRKDGYIRIGMASLPAKREKTTRFCCRNSIRRIYYSGNMIRWAIKKLISSIRGS